MDNVLPSSGMLPAVAGHLDVALAATNVSPPLGAILAYVRVATAPLPSNSSPPLFISHCALLI